MTESTISLEDKKTIIIDFLMQCNNYSESMLDKYKKQLLDEQLNESAGQKIHDWTVYKDFNDYAIRELNGRELDDWLI